MSAFIPSAIEVMKSDIMTSGLVYANRYEVILTPPPVFQNQAPPTVVQSISLRCDSILIPGRALNTIPYRIYGPARNMPVEAIYSGELSATFILSSDLREKQFFENWINAISNPIDYKFEYYANYVTQMQINMLDRGDKIIHTAMVEEVYPKTIGDLQVGYDKDNEYMKLDITLAFRRYVPQFFDIRTPPPPPSPQSPAPQPSALGQILGNNLTNNLGIVQ